MERLLSFVALPVHSAYLFLPFPPQDSWQESWITGVYGVCVKVQNHVCATSVSHKYTIPCSLHLCPQIRLRDNKRYRWLLDKINNLHQTCTLICTTSMQSCLLAILDQPVTVHSCSLIISSLCVKMPAATDGQCKHCHTWSMCPEKWSIVRYLQTEIFLHAGDHTVCVAAFVVLLALHLAYFLFLLLPPSRPFSQSLVFPLISFSPRIVGMTDLHNTCEKLEM